MQSFEMFVGKNVKITVSFSHGYPQGGSHPTVFRGVLNRIENEVCVFSDVKIDYGRKTIDYSNNVVINKQYIVMIAEM